MFRQKLRGADNYLDPKPNALFYIVLKFLELWILNNFYLKIKRLKNKTALKKNGKWFLSFENVYTVLNIVK